MSQYCSLQMAYAGVSLNPEVDFQKMMRFEQESLKKYEETLRLREFERKIERELDEKLIKTDPYAFIQHRLKCYKETVYRFIVKLEKCKLIVILYYTPTSPSIFEKSLDSIKKLNPKMVFVHIPKEEFLESVKEVVTQHFNNAIFQCDDTNYELSRNNLLLKARKRVVEEYNTTIASYLNGEVISKDVVEYTLAPYLDFDKDDFNEWYVISVDSNQIVGLREEFSNEDVLNIQVLKGKELAYRKKPFFFRLFANVVFQRGHNNEKDRRTYEPTYKKYTTVIQIQNTIPLVNEYINFFEKYLLAKCDKNVKRWLKMADDYPRISSEPESTAGVMVTLVE